MELNALNALSPIDGRYRDKTKSLSPFFSEAALIRYRVYIEIEYLIALLNHGPEGMPELRTEDIAKLKSVVSDFDLEDARWIKEKEKETNHDVKAVEYFVKSKLVALDMEKQKEWVHFALTSQDINNTAIPRSLKDATEEVMIPALQSVIASIKQKALVWKHIPMLARTHGQPASPTRLGKEMMVFVDRLEAELSLLKTIPFAAKFGGATGNFNAHHVAFPNFDWIEFSNTFVNQQLGLKRSQITTQIEHYDSMARFFDCWKRINTILIDFSRDIWTYILLDYFKQEIKAGEIGSSAMPHKVNPIDFENAEGNLGIANALFEHLSAKLPISRLQRDLTDSTVLRTIGVPMAHTLIALSSLAKGWNKLTLNQEALQKDLNENQAVLAEAIQTMLRSIGYENPYEKLKDLTRTHHQITKTAIDQFIHDLDVPEEIKERMRKLSPENYIGIDLF
jgi:adenylosuccinate lyase